MRFILLLVGLAAVSKGRAIPAAQDTDFVEVKNDDDATDRNDGHNFIRGMLSDDSGNHNRAVYEPRTKMERVKQMVNDFIGEFDHVEAIGSTIKHY